jgi:hypothetical protein
MAARNPSLIPGGHTADQIARRDAAIERLREALAEKPLSRAELAVVLGIPARTVYGYLCSLQEVGEVYQMDHTDEKGRKVWALDNAQHAASSRGADEHQKRAWIVPARQMGMPRHWMDVALFGPAAAQPLTIQQG